MRHLTILCVLLLMACATSPPPELVIITPTAESPLRQASSTEWVQPQALDFPQPDYDQPLTEGQHVARQLEVTDYDSGQPRDMAYWVYTPPGYAATQESWPAILFLHGSGGHEGGNPYGALTWGTPLVAVERAEGLPFVIITPHYPADQLWEKNVEQVEAILDAALAEAKVDEDRIYITGVSAGGYAAWAHVITHPDRYAAMASISGSGYRPIDGLPPSQDEVCRMQAVPTWAIHGGSDQLAPVRFIDAFLRPVENCPDLVDFEYTIWPEENHLSTATRAYTSDDLYTWFLSHSR